MTTDWKAETLRTYNKSARELARYFRGIGSRTDDIDIAFKLADNPSSAKVVEIGCGDGRDAKEIVKRTTDYLGFDISSELIKLARAHVPHAKFEVADATKYKFDEEIDIIFAFASLLHLDKSEVKQVLASAARALKPGGIFYISLKFADKYQEYIKEDKFGRRKFYLYNAGLIETLASDSYKTVHSSRETIGSTQWFEIALQKR